MKKGICFVVPLYNESKVVRKCLNSLAAAGIDWDDVYVTDDGSTDDTLEIIQEMGFPQRNVKKATKNAGKAMAHASAFEYFDLERKYEWLNFMDADSHVDKHYFKRLKEITSSAQKDTVAFCARVRTRPGVYTLPTAYRVVEYFISHWVYKEAQTCLNMVTVLPGCGSCYRTKAAASLFENTDHPTITEDMDWTIHTHLENGGNIVYDRTLEVYTQDPNTVRDYLKQLDRWTKGCWQVYLKRKMWKVWEHQTKAELSFLLLEGTVFSAALLGIPLYSLITGNTSLARYLLMDMGIFAAISLVIAVCEKDIRPLLYLPTSYMMRVANCVVYLNGFFQVVIRGQRDLFWNKVERY